MIEKEKLIFHDELKIAVLENAAQLITLCKLLSILLLIEMSLCVCELSIIDYE